MGEILVHEFITLDGVIEAATLQPRSPGFDPKMGEAIGGIMAASRETAARAGARTRSCSRVVRPDRRAGSRRPVHERDTEVRRLIDAPDRRLEPLATIVGAYTADAIRDLKAHVDGDLYVSGSGTLVRAMLGDGSLVDRAAPVRVSDRCGVWPAAVRRWRGRQIRPSGVRDLRQRRRASGLPADCVACDASWVSDPDRSLFDGARDLRDGQLPLAKRFRRHAEALERSGRSPLCIALMRGGAENIDGGGLVADLFDGVPAPPGSVPQLRLMAALHYLVLSDRAPELAGFYPSADGDRPPEAVWPVALAALEQNADLARRRMRRTVQTNDPGRSTVLYAALLWLTDRYRLPIRLLRLARAPA